MGMSSGDEARITARGRPRQAGGPLAALVVVLLAAWAGGCGDRPTASEAPVPPPASPDVAAPETAAATRAGEGAVVVGDPVAAVFAATGARSFVEELSVTIDDAVKTRLYWFETTTTWQASPPGRHTVGSEGVTVNGAGTSALEYLYAPRRAFEVIRLDRRQWLHTPDGWSAPEMASGEYALPPMLALSRTFSVAGRVDLGRAVVADRATHRYRIAGDQAAFRTVWFALTGGRTFRSVSRPPDGGGDLDRWLHALDDAGRQPDLISYPGEMHGQIDLWVQDDGLVVRVRYRAVARDGRVFTGALDLRDFDRPVAITPPGPVPARP